MANVRQTLLPLANYPSGTHELGAVNIPDTATEFYCEIARCTSADPTIWPNSTTKLSAEFFGSTDGINWTQAGAFESFGGIHIAIGGAESAITTLLVPLPILTGRQLKATILIENGPLRTQGIIELRD